MNVKPLTADQVKAKLKAQGITVKQWADANDFDYETTCKVLQGVRKGNYGVGHKIAVALGLKPDLEHDQNNTKTVPQHILSA